MKTTVKFTAALMLILTISLTNVFGQLKETPGPTLEPNEIETGIVQKTTSQNLLKVYASDGILKVNVNNSTHANFTLEVFDLTGKTIATKTISGVENDYNELDLNSWKGNIVIARISAQNYLETKKIYIQ